MKYAYLSLGMVLVGMFGLTFIVYFQNITINDESEYYVLKESVEAAMFESIDLTYYRKTGNLKIMEEKFVANCTRRFFANIVGIGDGYSLTFYDIMEKPPKVSVVATSKTDKYRLRVDSDVESSVDIKNKLSGILEFDDEESLSGGESIPED